MKKNIMSLNFWQKDGVSKDVYENREIRIYLDGVLMDTKGKWQHVGVIIDEVKEELKHE